MTPIRALRLAALALLPLAAACEDNPNVPEIAERLVLTVNSVDNSLSLVPVEGGASSAVRTVGLGAEGSPVGVAARGDRAVVPLGVYPFAAVVDLRAGTLLHVVPLPESSGATGAAFLNDSLAVVANPGRNSVSLVNVLRGTAGPEVAVGTYPQAVVSDGGRVFVVNANLVSWVPAGPASVTVLDPALGFVRTIQLSGVNAAAAVVSGNRLYVLHSGTFGGGDGSLSVVDLQTLAETSHHTGFSEFPSSLAVSPTGDLYVGVYGTGILVWNPTTREFSRGPDAPLRPGGSGIVSGIGFGAGGRLHATDPGDCMTRGSMHRIASGETPERTVQVGVCPFGIAFADVPEEG